MASEAAAARKVSITALVISAAVLAVLIIGGVYLSKPAANVAQDDPASPEAKAYLSNLRLSDVTMQATENFMRQQVVEVQGKISNNGPRALASVEVYCLFSGVDGKLLHRERLAIVRSGAAVTPLGAGETRAFRLPFDSLPDGWNQAMPSLVIAQITFVR